MILRFGILISCLFIIATSACAGGPSKEFLEASAACSKGEQRVCSTLKETYWAQTRTENINASPFSKTPMAEEMRKKWNGENKFPDTPYKDMLKALEDACDANVAEACRYAADLYSHNGGTLDINHIDLLEDDDIALTYQIRACDLGDLFSCIGVLREYDCCSGLNVEKVSDEFLRTLKTRRGLIQAFFQEECDAGDDWMCYALGRTYGIFKMSFLERLNLTSDRPKSMKLMTDSCNKSVAAACAFLADLYSDGEYFEVDLDTAASFYTKACQAHEANPRLFDRSGQWHCKSNGYP